MANDKLRELSELGMEVISHTFHHPNLPKLRQINHGDWESEIVESKKRLEEIVEKQVSFFDYPYGSYDKDTIGLVAQYYSGALTTLRGSVQSSDQLFLVKRQSKT
ncbi:MAG: polysaccharide deacetylase family protein [Chloroflexi bacterium]|nr:polysaccharide deacetylase family protein [Chloroflexota bacterium]